MSGSFLKSAPRVDIVLNAESANTVAFLFKSNNTNQPIDCTGSTFDQKVSAADADRQPTGSVLLALQTGDGIAGDVSAGEFQPTFPAQDDSGLPPGTYLYQVRRLLDGSPIKTMQVGIIEVTGGIG
jgi:hypothetical protein